MRAALFFVIAMAIPASAAARPDWTFVQGDISAGAQHREDGHPETPDSIGFGSLYLGSAIPLDPSKRVFVGVGGEGTIDGSNGPYEWSVGGGSRFGMVWRFADGPAGGFPDLYVYTRITPFIGFRSLASEEYLGENPEVTRKGQGLRVGVGFTIPAWTATVYPALFGSDCNSGSCNAPDLSGFSGGGGEAVAIACVAAIVVLLCNHGELTWEVYREPGQPTISRVGWRVGLGF